MQRSAVLNVRNREINGQLSNRWQKRFEMETDLKHLYHHETVYEHHLLYDVYVHLVDVIYNDADDLKFNMLCECWERMKYDEDKSIVWLALRFCSKCVDDYLLTIVDEIRCYSL